MPDRIARRVLRRPAPVVGAEELVAAAVRKALDADLPVLPVTAADSSYAGVFGARELIGAAFPRYLKDLRGTAVISPTVEQALERHVECVGQRVGEHLDAEHPVVEDDYTDTQLAELFLHHCVQIIPVVSGERVEGLVPLEDFFRELGRELLGEAARRPPASIRQR